MANYAIRTQEDVDGNPVYVGEAEIGVANEANPVWRIKKISYSPLKVEWAEGSIAFNKVWNDRTSYNYK